MPNAHERSTNDTIQSKRDKIRQSLKEITSDLNSAMLDERLAYPVYIAVPFTGALLSLVCPLDPSDAEWLRITEIARKIVEETIGATRLVARPIPCAWAGATMAGSEFMQAV